MTPSPHLAVPGNYWRLARSPRYSLSFAFPLLVAYEALALLLSRLEMLRVRNRADVLLKQLFVGLGGRYGLAVFGLILVGGGAVLVGRDIRRSGGIGTHYSGVMAAESIGYGLAFGLVVGTLTGLLLPRLALAPAALGLPAQVMVSLGAGIYEELVLRVLL